MCPKSMESIIKKHLKVYHLIENEPHTVKEIADKTKIAQSTVYDMLKRLEVKKFSVHKYVGMNYTTIQERIEKWLDDNLKHTPKNLSKSHAKDIAFRLQLDCDEKFLNAMKRICKKRGIRWFPYETQQ